MQQAFPDVDILVNNAGIRTYKSVMDLQPEEWDRMLGVNLSAAFYCSHEVLSIFRQQGSGDIVNISSLSSTSALMFACRCSRDPSRECKSMFLTMESARLQC